MKAVYITENFIIPLWKRYTLHTILRHIPPSPRVPSAQKLPGSHSLVLLTRKLVTLLFPSIWQATQFLEMEFCRSPGYPQTLPTRRAIPPTATVFQKRVPGSTRAAVGRIITTECTGSAVCINSSVMRGTNQLDPLLTTQIHLDIRVTLQSPLWISLLNHLLSRHIGKRILFRCNTSSIVIAGHSSLPT